MALHSIVRFILIGDNQLPSRSASLNSCASERISRFVIVVHSIPYSPVSLRYGCSNGPLGFAALLRQISAYLFAPQDKCQQLTSERLCLVITPKKHFIAFVEVATRFKSDRKMLKASWPTSCETRDVAKKRGYFGNVCSDGE